MGSIGDIAVGDLIRWYEPDYPYYFMYEEYSFRAPKYGIIVEIHIPDPEPQEYDDDGFLVVPRQNIFIWSEDMAWIRVLTIGENLKKKYIYLDYDERYEVVSRAKK